MSLSICDILQWCVAFPLCASKHFVDRTHLPFGRSRRLRGLAHLDERVLAIVVRGRIFLVDLFKPDLVAGFNILAGDIQGGPREILWNGFA